MNDRPVDDPHPPIRYAGRALRAAKEFTWGTHRAMAPELTLARIRPHLRRAGITRVADITTLDTIGVPVAVAIRPGSATLAVEGGKGPTVAAACTSAAMEGIERFVGEVAPIETEWGTVAEVADRLPVPADEFPMMRHAAVGAGVRYRWAVAHDLRTGVEHLVPHELVGLPVFDAAINPLRVPWGCGSNGLASGNHLPEALCAGLYEVVERDATSCWQEAAQRGAPALLLDPASIEGPAISTVLEQLDRAGVDPVIHWCPTEIGVPVAMAYIVDRRHRVGVYKGYGCHLDPEIAIVRAVTEAVQARTIFVAGARDDLLRPAYETLKRSDVAGTGPWAARSIAVTLADIPDRSTPTFHGDVAVLLDLLARAGIGPVLAREIDATAFDVAVARVIVPALEPYRFPWIAMGRRAATFDAEALAAAATAT